MKSRRNRTLAKCPNKDGKLITGAEIITESLIKENVDVIFGYPGGQVIPIFDTLYDYDCFNFILPRHEQAVVHAADGYARVTGRAGVGIVTSGPGATNTVTGLATAYMDSIPMVLITGQVPTHLIGNDAFQESDVTGITRPISKHNFLVKDIKDLARTIKEAFHIAESGRPGPVVIDIPSDIQKASFEFNYPEKAEIRSYSPSYEGNIKQIKKAAELINKSKKAVLYVGGGVIISGAYKELIALAEKANIPVTMTLMGLGSMPSDHQLSMGMLGMHGTYYANHAVQKSDLLISVGARFDDRVTGKLSEFASNAKIIHIDIDPTSIAKNVKVDVPVVGDAKNILTKLISEVAETKHEEWVSTIDNWKKTHPLEYKQDDNLRPQYVLEILAEITEGKAIITTDVGQHQMWAAQYSNIKYPRSFLTSGGLGTMGFGFPAGLGAKLAVPEKDVFIIAGDGGVQMNIQELSTAVDKNIPVKIVIINNGFLGMVRQWQELFYKKRYSETILTGNPDFVKLAEAYNAVGIRVTKKSEVRDAFKQAMEIDNTVVMDFVVEPEENVFPFVPAGKALHEIIRGLA
ncbi:MAG: biosynthetic-type acetolactate synthase large subunit [bacterium]|nr:biosynthetic-type acetolactate synthase large subunit [bacterium]